MREGLIFDDIFPIHGPASAKLMQLKADCLLRAGVINAGEREMVYRRSATLPGFAEVLEAKAAPPGLLPIIPREPLVPEAAAGRL